MSEAETTLFNEVQARLAAARSRIQEMDVSDDVKAAALRRIRLLDRASRFDLSVTSREVAAMMDDLDAGELPLYE